MSTSRTIRAGILALPLAAVLWAAAPAQAQPNKQQGAPTPPTPKQPDEPPIIMNYLVMVAVAAAILGANAIPSKRGHQD
ncbi:MAG: hypothetical protein IT436_02050 [Phycisphaerales bacterium]|nr:hypothetical protein [Phycisphaerales bacterium]